jgi:K+ potassium transporter
MAQAHSDRFAQMRLEAFVRAFLIGTHQARIAHHMGGEDRGETAGGGRSPRAPRPSSPHDRPFVGHLFGPAMALWFAVIAIIGGFQIAEAPHVLAALNPAHAVRIFGAVPGAGFVVLGAVALAVTGGEALYADMGHFGRFSIKLAWFAVVASPQLFRTRRPYPSNKRTLSKGSLIGSPRCPLSAVAPHPDVEGDP